MRDAPSSRITYPFNIVFSMARATNDLILPFRVVTSWPSSAHKNLFTKTC